MTRSDPGPWTEDHGNLWLPNAIFEGRPYYQRRYGQIVAASHLYWGVCVHTLDPVRRACGIGDLNLRRARRELAQDGVIRVVPAPLRSLPPPPTLVEIADERWRAHLAARALRLLAVIEGPGGEVVRKLPTLGRPPRPVGRRGKRS